ncbi:hypothetical protein [Mesorhizobium escarrei]|uniref:hypothetical protein n=1 Tax=Mesorhizobium escarrei TaxID=666018 RepID=UPI0020A71918|nr:hypothetical protein [Mesorhizobium escarrei]
MTIAAVDRYGIDGLATDKNGIPKPIGMPWDFDDSIKAYVFDRNFFYSAEIDRKSVFTGTEEDINNIKEAI